VCPGIVDTAVWDLLAPEAKAAMMQNVAGRLPVGHVASAEEIAPAYRFLMQNPYMTGAVIDIDGGGSILPAR
jgi:NAD(P)-dependent dehydrogenase (short-subunit alcohol dehydrogenase family)